MADNKSDVNYVRRLADDAGLRLQKRGDWYRVLGLPGQPTEYDLDGAEDAINKYSEMMSTRRWQESLADAGIDATALADNLALDQLMSTLKFVMGGRIGNVSDRMMAKLDQIVAILQADTTEE